MKNRNPSSLANNGDPLIPLLKITKLLMPFPKRRRNSWGTDIDIPCAAILRWPHLLKGHECQSLQGPPLCQVLAPTSPYPSHPNPWIIQILVPTKFIPVSISSSPFRVQRFCKKNRYINMCTYLVKRGSGLDGERAEISVKSHTMAHKDYLHIGQTIQHLVRTHEIQCCHRLEDGHGHL